MASGVNSTPGFASGDPGLPLAGQGEAVLDVLPHFVAVEGFEREPPRHALVQLTQLGPRQQRVEVALADEDDLENRAVRIVDVREQPNLLEDVRPQVLRFVDHDDGVSLDGGEGREKGVERLDQFVAGGSSEPRRILRDDAEILEQLLDEVVAIEQRVGDDREERLEGQALQHGPAQQGLAGADVAGDDHQGFAPLEGVGDLRQGGRVRGARKQESGVGDKAERRLVQSEIRFVRPGPGGLIGWHACGHGTILRSGSVSTKVGRNDEAPKSPPAATMPCSTWSGLIAIAIKPDNTGKETETLMRQCESIRCERLERSCSSPVGADAGDGNRQRPRGPHISTERRTAWRNGLSGSALNLEPDTE